MNGEQAVVTELPDPNNDQRAYWMTQLGVLQGEAARFQELAEAGDEESARQVEATNAQIIAVTRRINNYDEEKAVEFVEEREAQRKGRRQLCYFMIVVALGLLAVGVWALT